jgi:hypothetical protein
LSGHSRTKVKLKVAKNSQKPWNSQKPKAHIFCFFFRVSSKRQIFMSSYDRYPINRSTLDFLSRRQKSKIYFYKFGNTKKQKQKSYVTFHFITEKKTLDETCSILLYAYFSSIREHTTEKPNEHNIFFSCAV